MSVPMLGVLTLVTAAGAPTVLADPGPTVTVETAADGTGSVVGAQDVPAGSSVIGYAISRDAYGNFIANVAATWTLSTSTGGVVAGDLVPAGDTKSATFTGHVVGTATVNADDGTFNGDSGLLTVVPGPLDHFTWSSITSPRTAGTGFLVTATAYDAFGNVKTNYDATGARLTTTLVNSPSGSTPTVNGVAFDASSNLTWNSGVGTATIVAKRAEPTANQSLTITASVADGSKTLATGNFAVLPGPLDHFVWGSVAALQTAGTSFSVTVTAYDAYDNIKTNLDAAGARLSTNMGDSPIGGATSHPTVNGVAFGPSSNLTWVAGVGTGTIVPKKASKTDTVAGQNQTLTITASAFDGSVAQASGSFAVQPSTVTTLTFTGQPIDTQVNSATVPTAVYATCAPSTTAPCALAGTPPAGSGPVAVTAVDAFGNLVLAQNIVMSGTGLDTNVTRPTSGGVATFGDALKESTTGNGRTLVATAALNGSANKTSGVFRVVTTLKGCAANNTKCINKALGNTNSKTYVNSWSQITTGTCFYCGTTNVLQSTQLVVNSTAPQCGITAFASDQVDQRVTGSNTQVTSSGLELIVIPKNTLKSSGFLNRSPSNFNVCFGAIWIGAGSPPQGWLGKTGATNNTPLRASPVDDQTVVPQGQRWYGIPADCGTAGLSSSDPCILKRTKQKSDIQTLLGADAASIMTDADLGIVIRVGGSWDGGSHPF